MFSCWNVGMLGDNHVRQEISFDIDWNELILPSMYERSKKGLDKLKKVEPLPPVLNEFLKRLSHNVSLYETMKEAGEIKLELLCDDISKIFYLTNEDYSAVSDMISNSLGMTLSVISDMHHQEARGIEPMFPRIKDKYFAGMFRNLTDKDIKLLNGVFDDVYGTESVKGEVKESNDSATAHRQEPMLKKQKRSILDELREND